ncbi:putative 1-phosphatidylinositol 3-phosphate 5-kinase [Scaptodrosophila lebanonensis]|uniref:1-phosphatidylinositol-3-phosphate 5-kinase n=1 Tax=Drosophila lebanonensis TaxID=7225 RepID=A0A6J2UGK3_DROLE|nr:putative 1-phosphatidylinositol 3-phosphate 5-kinase [Scaptodrosophila lebanonensis]
MTSSNNNNNNNTIHQHLHSPTKLTEFARNFEDKPESLFGRVVNKIQNVYNQSYNTVNDISSGGSGSQQSMQIGKSMFYDERSSPAAETGEMTSNSSSSSLSLTRPQPPTTLNLPATSETRSNSHSTTAIADDSEANEHVEELPSEANHGRSVSNVLKHISNIASSKNNNELRKYKNTELQSFWMPDSKAKECYDCALKFSTFRRKHHCRICGQIFCSKCCNQVVPGTIIRCEGDLKVCNYCSKIVPTFLKNPNLSGDLQAQQRNLTNKSEANDNAPDCSPLLQQRAQLSRKPSLGYQEERFNSQHAYTTLSVDDRKNILQQSNSLITLHEEMQRKLPAQNCGLHLIGFLNTNNKSSNKVQAVAILNAMLAAGFLQPIVPDTEQTEFDENLHYKFADLPRQIQGVIKRDAAVPSSPQFEGPSVEPQPPKDVSLNLALNQELELENQMRFTTTNSKLLESYCDHEDQLLNQLLLAHQLDPDWGKVLQTLCSTAANNFKPENCCNDLMDIRNFVNFKKVPGGKRKDSTIVHGVAFSKNVAHKDMATHVNNPRILLLQCPIVYERIEGKFVGLDTVLLQEEEYLQNVCARIMSFQPNVVLVHKNVARVAQDMLRSAGVTLVLDVKLSVMERLSRTLQCDIVNSIESSITLPKLGYCNDFYIRSYNDGHGSVKTLMFFEKLSSSRGYTCLLRGAHDSELRRVKKVASALLFARYNWRLEMSFLLDEFAQPLAPKPSIFDSKDTSPKSEKEPTADEPLESVLRSAKRPITERKSEDKIMAAIAENVADFTDPLRSTHMTSQPTSPSEQADVVALAVETRYDNRFRNALSSTLLSVSPFSTFPLPYLETEQGRKCKLRKLFPAELYFSKLWSQNQPTLEHPDSSNLNVEQNNKENKEQLLPPHPFLKLKITEPITSREIQTKLAEFRAFGGRFAKGKKMLRPKKKEEPIQRPQKISDDQLYKDALDPENHQRLPVLFCSFHYNPKSVSSFCKLPMLLNMKFYGQHDIMLGQFLQRYCCLLNPICASCKLPMLGHVRRYVHSLGCVHVYLTEDLTRSDPKIIYFTSWCTICNATTPSVPLSETSKCLSLAKYLEMRFHGHAYKRRPFTDASGNEPTSQCEHSLHRDYVHHFSFRGVGAKFQYTPIDVWEVGMPDLRLELEPPKRLIGLEVQEEIKNFPIRGHEVYTRIHERIADLASEDEQSPLVLNLRTTLATDQFIFKQKIEIVHTLLTDSKASSYDINDAIVMSKRALAESIELWGPRLNEIESVALKLAGKQANQIDAGQICTEELRPEHLEPVSAGSDGTKPPNLQLDSHAPVECQGEDTDMPGSALSVTEKKFSIEQMLASTVSTDKKSIKKILTQLLPSTNPTNLLQSPFSAQEHLTLPLGAIPIKVREQDLSSVIAYFLTSKDYQRALTDLNAGETSSGAETAHASPQMKRKQQESDAEDSASINTAHSNNATAADGEERVKTKSSHTHISLSFNNNGTQFHCKIYFAREFDLMRTNTLRPPKEDNSLYKKLEKNKMREELRISQSRTTAGAEMELIRKPSDAVRPTASPNRRDEQTDMDECRIALARSLCNSVQWEARGGKSGSRFCKTLDDRFVLKEMTQKDITIFQQFAPNYFEYINKCHQQEQPTLLAKIFGVFKVSIKKKDHFEEKSLLVMENLFYACDITNKFDLKGSERNRLVDPSTQIGETVLLDENLVQMSWSKPLYVLSHSKAVLRDAIIRDATFLEKNGVMDYSLLVGLDHKNSVLVLGIIDYIRTFTLDKKLESFVKQTGILGGSGKLPTVISPERYKQRFIDAMDRYFNTVPDRWEGLSKF